MTSEGRSTAMWTKSYRVSQHTRQLSPAETRLLCKSWRWLVSRSPSKGRVRRRFCRRFKMALIWRALSLSIVSWTTVRLEKTRSLRPSLLRWEDDSLYAPPLPRPLCLLACTFFWFVTQSILRDKSRTATLLLPSFLDLVILVTQSILADVDETLSALERKPTGIWDDKLEYLRVFNGNQFSCYNLQPLHKGLFSVDL